ncbi:MAG TPA: tRNA (N6-isopentenyl adenosine(37)-C2)-methylthiotransferase MiaB [Thermomicrobiales bacterium]|nr:tRNA (N6-isopentenyl adenosine(37)-C2)-methylthiotransferase MiaB [Thermomicrobiales bacterium]
MTMVPAAGARAADPAGEVERDPGNGKTYSIWTIGCQMNESESAQVGAALELAGYRQAPAEEQADLIVLNSCVVRQSAEQKVVGKLGSLQRLKRANPALKIALTGCMVTGQEENLARQFPHVDLFFRPSAVERLTAIVPELAGVEDDLAELPHYYGAGDQQGEVTAFMPIIFGCNYVCSYCIIPYRRGTERSRPLQSVVGEAWMLAKRGVRELTLLGQTVNAYGHDLPGAPDLADLLAAVNDVEGIERIRFLTSHPRKMTTKLIRAVADLPRVCEHINLPVQAGHDETLKRMRRNYTVDDYRRAIAEIRDTIPGVTIATDIIVGFAGETAEHFRGTLDLLAELEFDVVHAAMYSPRPRTIASRWEDDVPHEEKLRRHQAVEALQAGIAERKKARLLGGVREVLVDGQAKGRWRGRTRGNQLVFFDAPGAARDWVGRLVDVRVTETHPWYVVGAPE